MLLSDHQIYLQCVFWDIWKICSIFKNWTIEKNDSVRIETNPKWKQGYQIISRWWIWWLFRSIKFVIRKCDLNFLRISFSFCFWYFWTHFISKGIFFVIFWEKFDRRVAFRRWRICYFLYGICNRIQILEMPRFNSSLWFLRKKLESQENLLEKLFVRPVARGTGFLYSICSCGGNKGNKKFGLPFLHLMELENENYKFDRQHLDDLITYIRWTTHCQSKNTQEKKYMNRRNLLFQHSKSEILENFWKSQDSEHYEKLDNRKIDQTPKNSPHMAILISKIKIIWIFPLCFHVETRYSKFIYKNYFTYFRRI